MGVNLTGGTRFSPRSAWSRMERHKGRSKRVDPRPQIKTPGIAVQAAWTVHRRDHSSCLYALSLLWDMETVTLPNTQL